MEKSPLKQTNNTSQLLCDIYNKDLDLRAYLRQLGFSEEQTRYLINYCMCEISKAMRTSVQTIFVMKHDGDRLTEIIAKRYGLEKVYKNTLKSIGDEFGISSERVLLLLEKAMRVLGTAKARTFLENDLRNQLGIVIQQKPVSLILNGEVIPEEEPVIEIDVTVKKKSYSLEEVRKKYPRAYMAWTKEEDNKLLEMVKDGMTTKEIAKNLQRQYRAIIIRVAKIKLHSV